MNLKMLGALALMLTTALAHAELPKEVLLDKYIHAAASYFKNQQYQQCLDELGKAEQLAGGKLSSDLLFIRAKSHLELMQLASAKRQATKYIEREGKKGKYYDQALELIIKVEQQAGPHIEEMRKRADASFKQEKYSESFVAYKEAAELGDAHSQSRLGWQLRYGRGVPEDEQQSVIWLEKAASQGDVNAMFMIAHTYRHGVGQVAQDLQKAFSWYKQAASKGKIAAMVDVGDMYASGQGVKQDDKQAYEWYTKAAADGSTDAKSRIAGFHLLGRAVAKDEKKAIDMYVEVAASENSAIPLYEMAENFWSLGDYQKAIDWYRKAADHKNPEFPKAIYKLALFEELGNPVVPQDEGHAFEGYMRIVTATNIVMQAYAHLCLESEGCSGYVREGYAGMGRIYLRENAIGPDWRKAEENFNKAEGSTSAYFFLALIKATSPLPDQRDAQAADELLKQVVKEDSSWFYSMVRAAVRAEQGQFEQAVALQQKAIEQAKRAPMDGDLYGYWRRDLPEQLAGYQQRKPWRYAMKTKSNPSGGADTADAFNR